MQACLADQQELARVVEHDQRVGAILHDVDAVAAAGNGVEAANRIDKTARPEAAKVAEEAARFVPRSRWGRARHAELRALIEQRTKTMSDYADALRSDNLEQVVAAMTVQRDVEKRAIEVQRAIGAPANPSAGECAPP